MRESIETSINFLNELRLNRVVESENKRQVQTIGAVGKWRWVIFATHPFFDEPYAQEFSL